MGRDETETCITVPSFFKCPISLDVMRSPVSLCTGVTYDRACIQRWLDGGNDTCPATMQILRTKDFVPNLTLQRLIKIWSDSVGRHAAAGSPPSSRGIPTKEEVNESLIRLNLEEEDEIRLEILTRIVRFVKDSDANREFLSVKIDFAPMLVDFISAVYREKRTTTTTAKEIKLAFLSLKILDAIKVDRERLSKLILSSGGDCLKAILAAMRRGNIESKIESVRVLDRICVDARSKLIISDRDEILRELVKSIGTESDPSLIEASLSLLTTISASKRVRSKLISAKTITKIKAILLTETTSVSVTEKSLKLLETLSSKREGRSEICDRGDVGGGRSCVEGVVKKMLKVSTAATEHAVTILWCLCCVFKEDKKTEVEETVERSNGVTKLLVVIQSNCSPMVRQMAKDLIKALKVNNSNASSALAAYETNTTHITPF
ncbi:unnamed protein product [Cochlearia groenlandica]